MAAIVPTIDLVTNPESMGYDGFIDNVLIRLAVSEQTPMQNLTAEASAQRIDTSEHSEDIRDEVGQRYSRSKLSGGAGLDFMHAPDRPADSSTRFWDSKGVDVFSTDRGDVYESTLMHSVLADLSVSDIIDVAQIDGTIYYARAAGIYEYGVGLQEALTGIIKLVAMGNSLYTLDSVNGVRRYDPPSWTPVTISSVVYDDIWAVKSRILAAADNVLSDATDDSVLYSLPSFDRVTWVTESGPAVLMFATTGSIYSFALNQDTQLVNAGESKFGDEIPIMAASQFGIIGMVTSESTLAGGRVTRFYTGRLSLTGSYDLDELQLIFQVGDRDTTDDLTAHSILATRDSIYIAIPEEGSDEVTLWRYYIPTTGYARAHSVTPASTKVVSSFVEVDSRMYVALTSDDLWIESDLFISEGYVIGPLADFATADTKQWVGAELTGATLPSGTALELYDTTNVALVNDPDSSSWQLVIKLLATETSKLLSALSARSARYHAGKIIYRSNSARTNASALRSYSFRALPAPSRDILLRIPINVSDQIEAHGRKALRIPGRGKAIENALRAYEGQQVLMELYRPAIKVRGLIEQIEESIEVIPPRGSVRLVMYMRIRGTALDSSETVVLITSGASLGQDIAGLFNAGLGVPTT